MCKVIDMDATEISQRRNRILAMNIPADKKEDLLNRLDALQPEHNQDCDCHECNRSFDDQDKGEPQKSITDPTILKVFTNITNPLIPRVMNKKVTAFIVIGVGIAIAFVGFKMWQKSKTAVATAN